MRSETTQLDMWRQYWEMHTSGDQNPVITTEERKKVIIISGNRYMYFKGTPIRCNAENIFSFKIFG